MLMSKMDYGSSYLIGRCKSHREAGKRAFQESQSEL